MADLPPTSPEPSPGPAPEPQPEPGLAGPSGEQLPAAHPERSAAAEAAARSRGARPRKSALAFFAILLLLFLPALVAQAVAPAVGLLWSELFVFLLPAFTFAAASNLDRRAFLRLAPPPRRALVGLGALAGGACFVAGTAVMALTQRALPAEWVRQFDLSKLFDGPLSQRLLLAGVAALVAPVCEEITFRGYVLSAISLRRGPFAAIAGSTALFTLMHLDPVRLPALLLLGGVFGWLTWRSGSIWPAVAAHAANNGIAAALQLAAGATGARAAEPDPPAALLLRLLALGLFALGLVLAAYRRAAPRPPPPDSVVRAAHPADPGFRFSLRRVPAAHWAGYVAALLLLFAGVAVAVARGGGLAGAVHRAPPSTPVAPVAPARPGDRR